MLHPPFLLGIITGGAVIYWFTGAATQAVSTGAYRAVEFIKKNIKLEGVEKASVEDSKKVVEICTQYAQKGMLNIFLTVFFATLAFAFVQEYFFIGYLVSIAVFGLYQAIFMADAGGAWDNAKKVVEVELKAKGTELHAACVVGDTVGDPFKDTSSVALNPIIKFTTLFGLLAVELAIELPGTTRAVLFVAFLAVALFFVRRSFYGMRIEAKDALEGAGRGARPRALAEVVEAGERAPGLSAAPGGGAPRRGGPYRRPTRASSLIADDARSYGIERASTRSGSRARSSSPSPTGADALPPGRRGRLREGRTLDAAGLLQRRAHAHPRSCAGSRARARGLPRRRGLAAEDLAEGSGPALRGELANLVLDAEKVLTF